MTEEAAITLSVEARHALESGGSVQILITGYPTWLAITQLWKQGDELLSATLADGSAILIGRDAILGVRFGQVEE